MAQKVSNSQPIASNMIAFVAADIADGAILRRFDRDTPLRRIADGVIDHASVGRVAMEVGRKDPESRQYIGILAARAVLVGTLNALHLASTGEATKGNWNQKSVNLATAAFALIATRGNSKATHLAGAPASAIAIATVPSFVRGLGSKHTDGIRNL